MSRLPRYSHHHIPGSGPEGQRCGTCQHRVRPSTAAPQWPATTRSYCALVVERYGGDRAAPIHPGDAACAYWRAIPPAAPETPRHE